MKFRILYFIVFCVSFSGYSQNKYSGSLFLVGYSLGKSGISNQEYIENQSISKEQMKNIQYGTEIIVDNDMVVEVFDYNYGKRGDKVPSNPFLINSTKIDLSKNMLFTIKKTEKAESFLGGKKPDHVVLPFLNDEIYFQYLGTLIKNEFPNKILNFDLHLIAPIYDSFDKIYLDYSNEISPKILDSASLDISRTFEIINSESEIIYEKTPIKYEKGGSLRYSMGNTGIPSWVQNAEYPICPKSGDKMKFLIAFDFCESNEQIKVAYTSFTVDGKLEGYFKNLDFWGCGSIYIFINPKTKVVCYFIQNT